MNIEIELAGIRVRMALRLPETKRYFDAYITQNDCPDWDVRVAEEDPADYPLICPSGVLDPESEAYLLMPRVSALLLRHRRVMIHGVSFAWRGKSWLITAPSGTGKTTQLRHWQRLWGGEIELINGDKSVLALQEDGSFWLYSSPWTGKEGDTGKASAPLGGIVILQQADHNEIRRLAPRESVLRIYRQFLNLGDEPQEVRAMGDLESRLLDGTPVWLLENLGDENSARLTHRTLAEHEENGHESV